MKPPSLTSYLGNVRAQSITAGYDGSPLLRKDSRAEDDTAIEGCSKLEIDSYRIHRQMWRCSGLFDYSATMDSITAEGWNYQPDPSVRDKHLRPAERVLFDAITTRKSLQVQANIAEVQDASGSRLTVSPRAVAGRKKRVFVGSPMAAWSYSERDEGKRSDYIRSLRLTAKHFGHEEYATSEGAKRLVATRNVLQKVEGKLVEFAADRLAAEGPVMASKSVRKATGLTGAQQQAIWSVVDEEVAHLFAASETAIRNRLAVRMESLADQAIKMGSVPTALNAYRAVAKMLGVDAVARVDETIRTVENLAERHLEDLKLLDGD
jgi:hypothetical protein